MTHTRVLIVEDQSVIARDLQARLLNLGYHVSGIAASGEEAVRQASEARPDLVLMDTGLKDDLAGIETAIRIRTDFHLPIVYLTANSDEVTRQRANVAEPESYIRKPFDDTEIRSAIETALHKHRMERQLGQSETRFRSLLEHISDVILVVDAAGDVTYASPATLRSGGALPTHRLDGIIAAFVAPDDMAAVYASLRQVQARPDAQASIAECRIRLRDGDWHTFSAVATNLLHDPAVNGIVITAHDITEHQRAGERLDQLFVSAQRHARELSALNTAFHAMSSSLELQSVLKVVTGELQRLVGSESVSVLLRDGDELVFAAATGPGADELIGTRMPATAGIAGAVLQSQIPSISTHAPTDQRFYTAIDAQTGLTTQTVLAVPLIHTGKAIGVMEAINKAPDPSLQQAGADVFGGHDLDLMVAIAGSAVIAIENARLYEAQRDHNRRLRAAQPQLIQTEKMAALGRLTASMAHEINNPLQVVQGCLTLIDETLAETPLADGAVRATIQRDLAVALAEVERMAVLIRRLRDFYLPTRTLAATSELPVVLSTVLEVTARQLARQQISVEQHTGCGTSDLPCVVRADPDRVKQIVLNLVLNAVDAMPNGGRLRIDTRLAERSGHDGAPAVPGVRIAVGDTGPLIPAALLSRVFEPFHAVRTTQSSLGLAICYELVTSIGGEIAVTSEIAGGTVFAVWLPSVLDQSVNLEVYP
jgi:PAS domain S-box-containing protein